MKSHLFYSILLSLSVCLSGLAESSFWDVSTEPAALISSSSRQITLGLQFTSDVSGNVTGLRFYKSKKNTGTHTGTLWSASGTMLASVTFVNESASGWQTAQFREPVKITPNTPYVISYTAPRGQYAFNSNYPWPSVSRAPLRVVGSSPGVYTSGSGSRFPATARDNSNYWVDVLFSAETAPSEPQSTEETSLWQNTTIPAIKANGSDSSGITLGLKFQASAGGKVAGVRFYKGPGNTGTHVGSLWSASGKKLAKAYFSNESDSGWQEARFSSPVVVSANTTYIVSYFAPRGRYAMDEFFNWPAANTPFLSASESGAGVYTYGSGERFPTSTRRGRNYWVDVIYQPEIQTSPPVTYSISGVVQGTGATISLSGSKSATTVTDGQGSYSFTGLDNGTYTITPSSASYTFSPPNRQVTISSASVSGINFSGIPATPPPAPTFSISGTVHGSGAVLSLSGPKAGTTITDASGRYIFTDLESGTYVVSPGKSGYTFSPSSAAIIIASASVSGVDFNGSALPPPAPVVSLSWGPSPTPNVVGYNLYRAKTPGGPYDRINSGVVAGTSYSDENVSQGQTYYYVATAVDDQGAESTYSNQASASTN